MDTTEAIAREEIRALVTRYNCSGDRARLADLAALFAPDGILEIHGVGSFSGPAAIEAALAGATGANTSQATYWHHFVATHDIDVLDAERATGTAYFLVIDPNGLNHWGCYRDRYRRRADGHWRFEHRLARRDSPVAHDPHAQGQRSDS